MALFLHLWWAHNFVRSRESWPLVYKVWSSGWPSTRPWWPISSREMMPGKQAVAFNCIIRIIPNHFHLTLQSSALSCVANDHPPLKLITVSTFFLSFRHMPSSEMTPGVFVNFIRNILLPWVPRAGGILSISCVYYMGIPNSPQCGDVRR